MGAFSVSCSHVTLEAQEDATFNITFPSILSNREHGPYHARREVGNTTVERVITALSCMSWRVLPRRKEAALRGKNKSTVVWPLRLESNWEKTQTLFSEGWTENWFTFSISSWLCVSLVSWLLYPPRRLYLGFGKDKFLLFCIIRWRRKS